LVGIDSIIGRLISYSISTFLFNAKSSFCLNSSPFEATITDDLSAIGRAFKI
jgi:hypothetical protein